MPVSIKKRDGKFRIVEPSGRIAKSRRGRALDSGGHNTREKALRQLRAINRRKG